MKVIVAAVAALALSGCGMPSQTWPGGDPPGPKRASASKSLHSHLVKFAPGDAALTPRQGRSLRRFLRELDVGRRDPITLTVNAAESEETGRARRARVRELLRQAGYTVADSLPDGTAPHAWRRGHDRAGVQVNVLRYTVDRLACPDFSRPTIGGFSNRTSSNFGCATAQNLGTMVAEPRDLGEGRDPGPADGRRMGESVERYRDDAVKTDTGGLEAESTGQQ